LFSSTICGHVKTLFFNFNSVSGETSSSQAVGAGEDVGDDVGDSVLVGDSVPTSLNSVGDDVGGNQHNPHDLIQINLALPTLLPSSSYIREPHLSSSTICGHVKKLFFNFNSVSSETVSSHTVGAGEAVGDVVGDTEGDVEEHPPHDCTQINLALPRLLPLSSYIRDPHLFVSAICAQLKIWFFNFNSVSGETPSSQAVGAAVGILLGAFVVGEDVGTLVGDVVGDDVGDSVGHPPHDCTQINLALPRLLPSSS